MTDPISSYGRQFALDQVKTLGQKPEKRAQVLSAAPATQAPASGDRVELSLAAQVSDEPVFDRQKVDQIKQAIEQGHDFHARLRVEVAGRLVREDDGRLRNQRPRNRDPLLLAAGQLGGPVPEPGRPRLK